MYVCMYTAVNVYILHTRTLINERSTDVRIIVLE